MKKISLIIIAICSLVHFTYAQFTTSGSNVYYNSGNVGIGTTIPAASLDVGKSLAFGELASVLARLPEGNATGTGTFLGVKGYDTQLSTTFPIIYDVKSFSIEHSFYGATNSSINFLRGSSVTGGSISFSTNDNTERLRISYNGNVGIGITNPQNKLDVNGNVHAKQVSVDLTGWPDYVFKPNYVLPSLTEVKTFIDQNHHLPEMPSKVEVAKDGLNLGEMNKLLTKKVEELTLYLIEQNKQLADQKNINESLQKQINDLATRIKNK